MDDIYFSDKKKKNDKDEPSSSKRIVSDKFLDADYDDDSFELDFKKKGNAQMFSDKKENFKVDIADFDVDIPQPKHIKPTAGNVYSNGNTHSRTPQGKKVISPVDARTPQGRKVVSSGEARTPQGARVQPVRPVSKPTVQQKKNPEPPKKRPEKKNTSKKVKIALGLICVLLVFLGAIFVYGYSALGGLSYDNTIKENAYMDEGTLLQSENVRNILFIGSDERDGLSGQRSDSMILFSIDNKNGEIKLTSFLRDSYVYIPSKRYNTKLNAAYNYGGAQLLMDTLEYNFGVDIDEYVMVDYDVFIELVDLLGGITIHDVTEAEARYMREEVNSKKFKAGTNHIGGRAAMWYCRIRYVDDDFHRTERQRKVLSAIIAKAAKTNPFTLVDIVKQVLPNISTNLDRNELLTLGMGAMFRYMRYDIVQQQIPAKGTWSNAKISGQDVLKMDFQANKDILKEFIYE